MINHIDAVVETIAALVERLLCVLGHHAWGPPNMVAVQELLCVFGTWSCKRAGCSAKRYDYVFVDEKHWTRKAPL